MSRHKKTAAPAIEVPNEPGRKAPLESALREGQFGGEFIVKNFGETGAPSHYELKAYTVKITARHFNKPPETERTQGNGTVIVDQFDKFTISNNAGKYELKSKNGSTLTLSDITMIRSSTEDGYISLYDEKVAPGKSRNLGAVDRTIQGSQEPEHQKASYKGGAGNDHFSFPGYGTKDRDNRRGAKKHPDKTVHLDGGAGEDTLYLDWVSEFKVTSQGGGKYQIRSGNGTTVNLSNIELIHNSGEHNYIGRLSSVPQGKTVPLHSIMQPKQL